MNITMKKTKLEKNPNTKTTYNEIGTEVIELTQEQYKNMTSFEGIRFFRAIGGSEYIERNYTARGYLITKLISTSPDKLQKSVYEFEIS